MSMTLPLRINSLSEFADDTSVIISNRNFEDFCTVSNSDLSHMTEWFAANKSGLNLEKTKIVKFNVFHVRALYHTKIIFST
jgi:hypothetical protein